MKNYKKTFIGSFFAFFVGTSCCWLSSLAIWLGGAAVFGGVIKWVEDVQAQLVLLGIILLVVSVFLYWRRSL